MELTEAEARRFLRTMSFANVQDLEGYGFRTDLLETIKSTFRFLGELSREGKIVQARFIARRD